MSADALMILGARASNGMLTFALVHNVQDSLYYFLGPVHVTDDKSSIWEQCSALSDAYMRRWTGSSLVQIMACSAPSHYLNQCWNIVNWTFRNKLQWNLGLNELSNSTTINGWIVIVHPPLNINGCSTLKPRQNGCHSTDDTFKRILLNENVRILLKISLKFVTSGPINNIPALVQVMVWRWTGDKPLSEPMMVSLLTHICLNELSKLQLNLSLCDWLHTTENHSCNYLTMQ